MSETPEKKPQKSPHAEREERVLSYWKEKGIFDKSLAKNEGGEEFVFYEGPPTANGRPGIHHLEARAFKDAIPRYKTMRGYHVRRKGGWDTHGLPVELQVEKELGLTSKKEIESYGIGAFNDKCKESVWKYVHEWADFTARMGYWVDLKDPYITYKPQYIEALWGIMKTVDDKGLLYKDYKVVPWCPRCGTGLSSHELAQGYQEVKDLTVTVKFRLKPGQSIKEVSTGDDGKDSSSEKKETIKINEGEKFNLIAWTTTPWTLPGNAGLAVNPAHTYAIWDFEGEKFIAEHDLFVKKFSQNIKGIWIVDGKNLVGLEYEPLYPFLKDNVSGAEKDKLANAFKVYAADFVTTTDGTGIVHIAPMYGQDDFEVGTRENLPKHHLVNDDGTFKQECGFLAGRFVKDEAVAVDIIKDLAGRQSGSLLFHKEKHEHTYPFCWRCKTPLIYFARDSWYIRMSSLRKDLIKENEGINWEPEHIKEGRFGEWLREVKDWAISRERYWGTPLPIWTCNKCPERKVVGSVAELARKLKNTYFMMRHGEAEQNVLGVLNSDPSKPYHLTEKGREGVEASAKAFKEKIDIIYASPFPRTRETVEIFARVHGIPESAIVFDDRLREMGMGELEGARVEELGELCSDSKELFTTSAKGIENRSMIKRRAGEFLEEIEGKHEGKMIMVISHDSPLWLLECAAGGYDVSQCLTLKNNGHFYLSNAEIRKLDYSIVPHNADYELDLHRPHIDAVKLACSCGGEMSRVKEVMDVWFDSGAMPFAQDHEINSKLETSRFAEAPQDRQNSKLIARLFSKGQKMLYPADFISEAIDQTRGWFYTLHAIGVLAGKGKAFRNVICLGHILDKEGKKMSKSLGNIVDPWSMMDKYGADALRFWMYSINQPGDSKNFEEKTVDEAVKKVFNLAGNVLSFYKMYEDKSEIRNPKSEITSQHVLDKWVVARLDQTIDIVTKGLDAYQLQEPSRSIRDFIGDLSQWYLRRSRDRFKSDDAEDKKAALETTRYVLLTLSKIMAPLTPFFAEELYRETGGDKESVHLEEWPDINSKLKSQNSKIAADMEIVRDIASKGLEARMKAKINVRQPLGNLKLKTQNSKLSDEMAALIKDEVNVKDIAFDPSIEGDVELDTEITPELKEEGDLRELLRAVQDLRKQGGLSVSDKAVLTVETDVSGKAFVEKNTERIMSTCAVSDIRFGPADGQEVVISEIKIRLLISNL